MNIKRETAYKVPIKHLLEGRYVVQEGWNPNYIEYNDKKLSRVNVIGTIIGKENELFKLDDGTGSILLRSFENPIEVEVGKPYLIIGRPREYNTERYLVPEIIKEITNQDWIELRKKELSKIITINKPTPPPVAVEEPPKKDPIPKQILAAVEQLDEGDGVNVETLRKEVGECDSLIKRLIEEGEIFEIRPGVIKILT